MQEYLCSPQPTQQRALQQTSGSTLTNIPLALALADSK